MNAPSDSRPPPGLPGVLGSGGWPLPLGPAELADRCAGPQLADGTFSVEKSGNNRRKRHPAPRRRGRNAGCVTLLLGCAPSSSPGNQGTGQAPAGGSRGTRSLSFPQLCSEPAFSGKPANVETPVPGPEIQGCHPGICISQVPWLIASGLRDHSWRNCFRIPKAYSRVIPLHLYHSPAK